MNPRFVALKNFYSAEVKSEYVRGFTYTVQPQDTVLAGLVEQWLVSERIRMVTEDDSIVTGLGSVSEEKTTGRST